MRKKEKKLSSKWLNAVSVGDEVAVIQISLVIA